MRANIELFLHGSLTDFDETGRDKYSSSSSFISVFLNLSMFALNSLKACS